jgi:hypothetical protein
MLELFSLTHRLHHLSETEEEAYAALPERLRPFWGKRVFHPEPAAWHPRKRQHPYPRPLQVSAPWGDQR